MKPQDWIWTVTYSYATEACRISFRFSAQHDLFLIILHSSSSHTLFSWCVSSLYPWKYSRSSSPFHYSIKASFSWSYELIITFYFRSRLKCNCTCPIRGDGSVAVRSVWHCMIAWPPYLLCYVATADNSVEVLLCAQFGKVIDFWTWDE